MINVEMRIKNRAIIKYDRNKRNIEETTRGRRPDAVVIEMEDIDQLDKKVLEETLLVLYKSGYAGKVYVNGKDISIKDYM